MLLINFLGVAFLIGLAAAAPVTENNEDDKLIVTSDFFIDDFIVYTSQYDIVSLTVPLNSVNFDEDTDDKPSEYKKNARTVFFVEADVDKNGKKEYKGLYSLINGKATKILETGTDSSASNDDTTEVYLSAKDGIYVFNAITNKAEKYGSVTDSLIGIAKTQGSDVLYVLTEDHEVYKVTDDGNKQEKLQDVKDAQQIVLDSSNNLYFYGKDKAPYVVTTDGVKKISGLPENPTYVNLIKPPIAHEDGVAFAADDKVYMIYVNGTSEPADLVLEVKPTAFAIETVLIQYYSYNKNIYEFNALKMLEMVLHKLLDNLMTFLKVGLKQSIAGF